METRTCSICGGSYPTTKHNFEECYSLDSQWDMLVMDTNFNVFKEPELVQWFNCINPFDCIEHEAKWGNDINKKYFKAIRETVQWTTIMSEKVVAMLLLLNGHTPIKRQEIKGYIPDIETTDRLWEIKSRSYNTNGTAGEKILGVSKKYGPHCLVSH
jgi:hypothetical protein